MTHRELIVHEALWREIPSDAHEAALFAMRGLAQHDDPLRSPQVRALAGSAREDSYRLRVGRYRLLFLCPPAPGPLFFTTGFLKRRPEDYAGPTRAHEGRAAAYEGLFGGARLRASMDGPPDPIVRSYHGEVRELPALLARVRGAPLQLLRADRVYGADHLRHAAQLAARAVAEGRSRSADLPTETLVYAAGERQVHKALAMLGLAPGMRAIAVVAWDTAALDALARDEGWTRDDALLDGDAAVLDAFGVSLEERAMLPRERWVELILERVALVDVLKA